MHLEPIHITWITLALIFFSYRAWVEYLDAKYPTGRKKSTPIFSYSYKKPIKRDEAKTSQ